MKLNDGSYASYICPHCNKSCDLDQSYIDHDGQEIDEFCLACEEPIKIKVTLITLLDAEKRIEQ